MICNTASIVLLTKGLCGYFGVKMFLLCYGDSLSCLGACVPPLKIDVMRVSK